ncbi:MAG: hypothetical protein ABSD47_12050 [Candidatus Methylomirabilota bacterium]
MLAVPSALQSKFDERLRIRSIPDNLHGPYQKWLRYYLDVCQKYHFPPKRVIIFLPNGFFPAKQLTHEIMTGEYRRYHLHETNVQKAIKQAISAATAMRGISPGTGHWR